MDFASAIVTLLIVMDPLGNIPNFIVALRVVPEERRRKVVARELLFALAILVAVFFGGRGFMRLMQLSNEALGIAGGVMLFLIALRMIFPEGEKMEQPDEEPFIVPLATPLIAGPSVMATIMLFAGSAPDQRHILLGALVAAWLVSAVVLMCAPFFARILRRRGLLAVERLMGMLLVVVAVQMFLNGLHLTTGVAR
jgi:multiple antibiotic resistance protein